MISGEFPVLKSSLNLRSLFLLAAFSFALEAALLSLISFIVSVPCPS